MSVSACRGLFRCVRLHAILSCHTNHAESPPPRVNPLPNTVLLSPSPRHSFQWNVKFKPKPLQHDRVSWFCYVSAFRKTSCRDLFDTLASAEPPPPPVRSPLPTHPVMGKNKSMFRDGVRFSLWGLLNMYVSTVMKGLCFGIRLRAPRLGRIPSPSPRRASLPSAPSHPKASSLFKPCPAQRVVFFVMCR